ncbi:MAG: hypothetical protein ACOC3U_08035 [Thiohalospira sp.]
MIAIAFISVFVVLAVLATLAQRRGGAARHREAVAAGWGQLRWLLVRVPLAVVAASLAAPLVPAGPVSAWLGPESGLTGIAIASLFGGVLPGGPVVAFPLVIVLEGAGAGRAQLVALITGWSVLAIHRLLIFEAPLLGWPLTLRRLAASLPLPFIAGMVAGGLLSI